MRKIGMLAAILIAGCSGGVSGSTEFAQLDQGQGAAESAVLVGFKNGIDKGAIQKANGRIHKEWAHLNAVAAYVPTAALAGLAHNPNIEYVEEDAKRYLYAQTVPFGIDAVQARDIWDADRDGNVDEGAPTGAGTLVCIIDSGLHTGHEDFAGVSVIGGYPADWSTDRCGHGTHVAGTIDAANNALGVVGVSPGAIPLYIVKVFGNDCSWTYASTLVDAANRCKAAGAKVISMSLGGTTKSKTEDKAFASLYAAGILSIAAAGNDGNTATSYPAGYASVVSVAAVDSNNVKADFSQVNADVEISAPGVGVLSTVPFITTATLNVGGATFSGGQIEFSAEGSATGALVDGGICDSVGAWAGKIVLCQRGTIAFYDKVMNAQNGGAAAAIIYNNVSGGFAGTLGEGNTSVIPAISLSMEDGLNLVANYLGQVGELQSFVTIPASGYEAWNGTSMATPHVSAVAALVWSGAAGKTNVQLRSALTGTAKDLGVAGRDSSYGYGLVQAYAAWQALGGGGGGTCTPVAEICNDNIDNDCDTAIDAADPDCQGPADTTPPVISNVSSAKTSASGAFEIRWTTNEPATSAVRFDGAGTYSSATLVTSHVMGFRGTKGAVYTYYVISQDAAGNSREAGPYTHRN